MIVRKLFASIYQFISDKNISLCTEREEPLLSATFGQHLCICAVTCCPSFLICFIFGSVYLNGTDHLNDIKEIGHHDLYYFQIISEI